MKEKDYIEDFVECEESLEFFQDYHSFSELKSSKVVTKTKKEVSDNIPDNDVLEKMVDDKGYLTTVGRMKFVDLVVEFCQVLSGKRLYSYQLDAAKNVVREFLLNDAEEICLLFSRQSGKTEVLSVVIAGLLVIIEQLAKSMAIKDLEMYKEGLWIGYFAGTTYQVETLFERTSNILENSVACEILQELDEKKKTRGKILRIGKSFIFAKTAAKQSKVESKTYHICLVDECVSKDTLVTMSDGTLKKISKLKNGDKILGYYNNKIIEDKILKVWCNGVKDVYKINHSSGSIICTDNHKFYTNRGWLSLSEIMLDFSSITLYSIRLFNLKEKLSEIRISDIEYLGEEEVWDMTTEISHTFFADGILVHNCQDVDAQMIRKCYSGDTMIPSKNGEYYSIKEIVKNKLPVWSYSNPPQLFSEKEIEYHYNGEQDLYKIGYSDGTSLKVTLNHRHLIYNRNWRTSKILETKDLQIGMRSAYVEMLDLPIQEGTIEDYNKGLITGHFIGNGCLRSNKIQYSGNENNSEKILNSLKLVFSKGIKRTTREYNNCCEVNYSGDITSLIEYFKSIDLWNKLGKDKYFSNKIFSASKEFHKGLIEGLWETDGCVGMYNSKPCLSYSSVSKTLIEGIQRLLIRYGIHGYTKSVSLQKSRSLKGLKNYTGGLLYSIEIKDIISIRNFYKHFKLNTKQWKLDISLKTIENKSSHNKSQFYPDGMKFKQIQDIEYIGKGETYCVTIPTEDHLIIVDNGKISSNSISPMLSSTAGLFIKSGTPNTKVCELYEACLRTKRRNLEFEDLCPTNEKSYSSKVSQLTRDITSIEKQLKVLQRVNTKADILLYKRKLEQYNRMKENLQIVEKNWKNKETPRKFYFEVPWQIPAKENPRYKRYVDKEKVRLGEHSDDFMMSYALTWMISRGMFITDKVLATCGLPSGEYIPPSNSEALKLVAMGDILEYWDLSKTVAGIDWGKTSDSTVMSIFYVDWDNPISLSEDSDVIFFNKYLIYWLELLGDDYEDQYPQIEDAMHKFNVGRVVMDANGNGDPIFDRFVHKFENKVDIWGIKTNSSPLMNDIIKHWASEISKGRFHYPASEDAKETREYKMFQVQMKGWYKTWKNGYLTCHHDQNDKEAHDDYCSSALFGVWGATKRLDNELEFGKSIFPQKRLVQSGGKPARPIRSWRR